MTKKTIQVLAAVVVVLVLLVFVQRGNDSDTSNAGGVFLPDFKSVANEITEIRIARSSDDDSVLFSRDDDSWIARERDNYTADVGKIRGIIIALADAEIVEEKTANPENYAQLGLNDPRDGGSGVEIVVSGAEFSYNIVIGNVAQGNFRYARNTDNPTSFLINQNPNIPQSIGDWLVPDILDVASARIRKVTISHADGETISISKTDETQTDFTVADLPDGRELKYATVANGIAGALGNLTLDDVRATVDGTPATTAIFDTWDGLQITAEVIAEGDDSWIDFSARAIAVEMPGEEEVEVGSEDVQETVEQVSPDQEVEEINQRVSRWQFKVGNSKRDLFIRKWEDILKAEDTD